MKARCLLLGLVVVTATACVHTPPEPKLVFIDRDSEEPLSPDRALLVHADCLKEMNKVPIPAKPAPTPVSGGANSSEGGILAGFISGSRGASRYYERQKWNEAIQQAMRERRVIREACALTHGAEVTFVDEEGNRVEN